MDQAENVFSSDGGLETNKYSILFPFTISADYIQHQGMLVYKSTTQFNVRQP
jgi:hypothetical protein